MQRKIIHCDCDCFFAAVEMRDNPALMHVPMAIGGDPSRRGVIATCNYPAREYGVRSAMATAHALKLCPELKVLHGNMDKYREASRQIMDIFRDYTDIIEPLSLDEAFLDVTGTDLCQGSATYIAEEIRQRVKETVGITISAGVAPNKFIAKIASDWNKPDGLYVVHPTQVTAFLDDLSVDKISGVGKKTAEKLGSMGVSTCLDLRKRSLAELVERFGKFGKRLFELSRGMDDRPVQTSRIRKSISVEHTYANDLGDVDACLDKLPTLLEELATRFEKHGKDKQITGVIVKVKFFDFIQTTAEHAVSIPELAHFRQLLIDAFSRGGRPVRLLGVGYKLKPALDQQPKQLNLLDTC